MSDLLITLIKIAGVTLLITFLWALSLAVAYLDIQRRRQAGQELPVLPWMLVVAFIPFIGLAAYLIARLVFRSTANQPRGKRQTDLPWETRYKSRRQAGVSQNATIKAAPPDKESLPTIFGSAISQEGQPAPKVQYRFIILRGPALGRQYSVDQLPAQIGRDYDSAVRLDQDVGVSRKHAQVYLLNGSPRIRDLKSRHGTQVNGKPVTDHPLRPGDQIQVGLTSLLFQNRET